MTAISKAKSSLILMFSSFIYMIITAKSFSLVSADIWFQRRRLQPDEQSDDCLPISSQRLDVAASCCHDCCLNHLES